MSAPDDVAHDPPLLDRITAALAVAGGIIVVGVAVLVTVSVVLRWLTSRGVPGDFELVQTGMAVGVFAFLPICQLRAGNIVVDTFTLRAPASFQAALDGLWSLVYALVAALIGWQTVIGAQETIANGTTSMVLRLPIGWAMIAAAVFAFWLGLVALVTAFRTLQRV